MSAKIRIVLVDDHAVVRAGFKLLLAAGDEFAIVGEAENGLQAVSQFDALRPDVMVMDLSMPGLGGLESIRRIVRTHAKARILVFSVFSEAVYVQRALKAGAKGYISKNSAPEILPQAIRTLMQGACYIEQGLDKRPRPQAGQGSRQAIADAFSEREFAIFTLLAQGLTVAKIAEQLSLGYKTVANYATQIKKKFQVESIAELVYIAEELGIKRE